MALDIEQLRGFSVFSHALRRYLAASETISRDAGVTRAQFLALMVVKAEPTGRLTMSDLADGLLLTHHAAVQMVDRLSHLDLVERRHSERDRRVVELYLTVKGESLLQTLATQHFDEILRQAPMLRRSLNQMQRLAPD